MPSCCRRRGGPWRARKGKEHSARPAQPRQKGVTRQRRKACRQRIDEGERGWRSDEEEEGGESRAKILLTSPCCPRAKHVRCEFQYPSKGEPHLSYRAKKQRGGGGEGIASSNHRRKRKVQGKGPRLSVLKFWEVDRQNGEQGHHGRMRRYSDTARSIAIEAGRAEGAVNREPNLQAAKFEANLATSCSTGWASSAIEKGFLAPSMLPGTNLSPEEQSYLSAVALWASSAKAGAKDRIT